MSVENLDFQLLFENSPDVLLVCLPDAPRFTQVACTKNRLLATHTTLEETIGRGLFEMFPDNPEDPAATGATNLRASMMRVLATKEADTMAVQKYDIRTPDGNYEVKYWSPRNFPILSADGTVAYIIHRVEDVTELVRASELGQELRGRTQEMEREVVRRSRELDAAVRQLREANEKLQSLDVAKTAFFSNISHEFRTPLTLMLGPMEDSLTDAREPLPSNQRIRVRLAYDNAMRLLKLVNELLDFSRIEAGRLGVTLTAVDLSRFTRELALMFDSVLAKAGIELIIDTPALSESVWIDRDMWEKVVSNLLSNAFKFTLSGSITVKVTETPSHAVLEVIDTGVGIPDAELPRVFERFYRVTGAGGRTHEGAGIGLALVRELISLQGGDVSVRSNEKQGTTFRVAIAKGLPQGLPQGSPNRLPQDLPESTAAAMPSESAHAAEASRWLADSGPVQSGQGQQSVLIVDDNADLRAYMSGLLAPHYRVTTANDGVEALAAMRASLPDIVVCDVMMPRMNGIELVRAMRAEAATSAVPVIMLSARAGEEAIIEGLDAGSDDYLTKPFAARELLARVRSHLQLALLRRDWLVKLEHANRELDAFSHSVAHDLRAPLRAVDAFTQMLQEDYAAQLDDEGRRRLDVVRSSAQRMAQLIEDLLSLSRINRGELARTMFSLSDLVRATGSRMQQTKPRPLVELAVEDALSATADLRLTQIIIENLLENAWKFSAKNPRPRVEFGTVDREGGRAYFIRDNGAGFDMRHASKLFGAFQRLHTDKEFPGTGIGLATVERIVTRHGGQIWAEAAVGHGATFYFTLGEPRPF